MHRPIVGRRRLGRRKGISRAAQRAGLDLRGSGVHDQRRAAALTRAEADSLAAGTRQAEGDDLAVNHSVGEKVGKRNERAVLVDLPRELHFGRGCGPLRIGQGVLTPATNLARDEGRGVADDVVQAQLETARRLPIPIADSEADISLANTGRGAQHARRTIVARWPESIHPGVPYGRNGVGLSRRHKSRRDCGNGEQGASQAKPK